MIQPTSNTLGFVRADALATKAPKASQTIPSASDQGERLSSGQTDTLRAALAQNPEIRPEVVQRGLALALDVHWPPLDIVKGLAKIMVNSADTSEQ